ncbi:MULTISPECIES: hypothetical protein [Flavobacteriaceae]|uniref:hypothetical protein n=1 Tax=Flavobacteriaceae TaxID=49546 RepID=UPI000B7C4270|nr:MULTISPECIES: hypothetical protein [Flavobacteriaceae]MBE7693734.1 hypothetical protein [Tenacibaculum finnmarkense genomovar finnmarkense]MCB6089150.1 hypothetical protein [Flavobacterium psychrophilum]MCB6231849.1 hypothetical protein [Flavobacterium psychrophilum]MEB3380317.1 hypothetical protein [Flavobacterium psychrophilum]SNA72037.1 conserved hypothetical protein [Flavobacterium psychrophilum]
MNNFKNFGIKPELSTFTGDKIKIDRVLNAEITVLDYKIEDSKVKLGTKLLILQIEKSGTKHVIFTGSTILMQMIGKIPKESFPFITTIIKDSEHLEFT